MEEEKKVNPEEQKKEEQKEEDIAKEIEELEKEDKGKEVFKTALKIALGIVFILIGVVLFIRWWPSFLVVLKGCLGPFLIFAGIIAIAIARE